MTQPDWTNKFEAEISLAEKARAQGNEGRARVCARRAAGIAIKAYLENRRITLPGPSAMDQLRHLATFTNLPKEVRRCIESLTIRVNEDFSLPEQIDLIQQARLLADLLHKKSRD